VDTEDGLRPISILLDSGADSNFISDRIVEDYQIKFGKLSNPITLKLADGSTAKKIDKQGLLGIKIGEYTEQVPMFVAELGEFDVILGHPWLYKLNPEICWQSYKVRINSVAIQGRALGAHPAFRPVPETFPTLHAASLDDSRLAEDVYPFMKTRSDTTVTDVGVPQFIIEEYRDVYSEDEVKSLPPHRKFDSVIDTPEDVKPYYGRLFNLTSDEKLALKEWIDENLGKGFIRRSTSPWGAPCFFVKQKGKLRLCMDYRKLNAVTTRNSSPIPLISELLRSLTKGQVFSALDLRAAYNQVRIKDSDVYKTGFITPFGHYESLVMLFGLTNAPAEFQAFINSIFYDIIGVFVVVYLDDIIVYSENEGDHEEHLRQVFNRLRENKLYLNLSKCQFYLKEVSYLGYIVSSAGLIMDPAKIKAILDWPSPVTKTQLKSFLGFTNFYRKFIASYSVLCLPLNRLLKKSSLFVWGEEHERAYNDIKEAFKSGPVLIHPDESKPFMLETDASC
jgi:hypothetical protein